MGGKSAEEPFPFYKDLSNPVAVESTQVSLLLDPFGLIRIHQLAITPFGLNQQLWKSERGQWFGESEKTRIV